MKQSKSFILLAVVAAVLILGVAYANITNIGLEITGSASAAANAENFKVSFLEASQETAVESGDGMVTYSASGNKANFTVSGLDMVNDTASVTFTIQNTSTDITAKLTNISLANNSNDYISVAYTGIADGDLIEAGSSKTVTLTATLNKATATAVDLTNITLTFEAAAQN